MRPEFPLRIKGLLICKVTKAQMCLSSIRVLLRNYKASRRKMVLFCEIQTTFMVAHWLFTAGWQFSFLEKCARVFYGQQEATHCQIATGWILPFFKRTLQWLKSLPLSARELRKTFSPGTTAMAQPVAGKHRGEGRHWPETELFSKFWWLTSCFRPAAL